jgi:hypothetical protein
MAIVPPTIEAGAALGAPNAGSGHDPRSLLDPDGTRARAARRRTAGLDARARSRKRASTTTPDRLIRSAGSSGSDLVEERSGGPGRYRMPDATGEDGCGANGRE